MKIYLFIITFISSQFFAQSAIYENNSYSLFHDRVVEGEKEAVVISPREITTNYVGALADGFDRLVKFKFALNGADNERPSGMDHEVYLNPKDGYFETPLFIFGQPDPVGSGLPQGKEHSIRPDQKFNVKFRVDMRNVLREFEEKGYYTLYNGEKLNKSEFKGVFLAGSTTPLIWDFDQLPKMKNLELSDADGDGIFEVTLDFVPTSYRSVKGEIGVWKLKKDVSQFPQLKSTVPIVEAMYNLSLEELLENVRPDGAFMAGAKWNGVWTRDISYSIVLSLASIMPDASKVSLMAKVKDGMIIQDTGTGGSYPVSSDRMTWALAAWEIYKSTGDLNWLQTIYPVIKKSVDQDLQTLYNEDVSLASGESSFLDWREQSYPEWMDPKDIYISKNLGTNIVHFATLDILANIEEIFGYDSEKYQSLSDKLREEINRQLWVEEKGYYGQYLYGRNYLSLSPKSETLGEALSILYEVADQERAERIVKNTPVTEYGSPCFYPQIPGIPPYHNNGIWPFVQAYHTWAAAKVKNEASVVHGFASIYRPAMLYLTNKENFVAESGDFNGTQINSNRQLWSVAGNIALVHRVLFGMEATADGITLDPFIPEAIGGEYSLTNYRYHKAILNIKITGFGTSPESVLINNVKHENVIIPNEAEGVYDIVINMNGSNGADEYNLVENRFSPETPDVNFSGSLVTWSKVPSAKKYKVYINGEFKESISTNEFNYEKDTSLKTFQVKAVDQYGFESFLSEPIHLIEETKVQIVDTDNTKISPNKNTKLEFNFDIDEAGTYAIDFYYGNGTGPINTDNNCAIRTVMLNGQSKTLILPQRGTGDWKDRGYSNPLHFSLKAGEQNLLIEYSDININMDGEINEAVIEHFRIMKLD
ncbi:MAG: hypothetical protein SCALA702_32340 [Melioribacteraceae bacterium]|nr:MAG: hypothetical protein SCALA702_32340 [Melioribacteraceae bacterium]